MRLFVLLLLLVGVAHADDGGGRDVTVAVFSTRAVHAVSITPVGANVWMARCATCKRETVTSPWTSNRSAEVWIGGLVRVRDDGSGTERVAAGVWHVRRTGTELDVVLTLPSERYVAMAVAGEADPKEPAESLRAMAIVARTFALNGGHYPARGGHLTADLCDSTQCMAMRWSGIPARVSEAVRSTAGETLWSGSRRAEVYLSGSCGGTTEDAGAVWPSLVGLPYLKSHADPYCVRRDGGAKWHAEIPLSALAALAADEGWKLPAHMTAIRVAERSRSGRALRLVFSGSGGESEAVAASALRFGVGRAMGFGKLRSDWYDASLRGGVLVLDGRGHGHGVGLCQSGALQMAAEGKRAADILSFYFPGTKLGISPHGEVWAESVVEGVRVLSVGKAPDVAMPWRDAQRKFPGAKSGTPVIVFAPTVEMFRQMSRQPGWMLASTRGNEVLMQPAAVVGGRMPSTLLHEMLHVLVESEASPAAPLWLREGLVETLARESGGGIMTLAETESALANPGSRESSERAHRAAAARVRGLLAKYGLATVRGWLRTGPPASI